MMSLNTVKTTTRMMLNRCSATQSQVYDLQTGILQMILHFVMLIIALEIKLQKDMLGLCSRINFLKILGFILIDKLKI